MSFTTYTVIPATLNSNAITIEIFNGTWSTYIDGQVELNCSRFKDKRKLKRAIYKTVKDIRNLFGSISVLDPYLAPEDNESAINSYIDSLI